jgi:hypothetical protein
MTLSPAHGVIPSRKRLESLGSCGDADSLRLAVRALCTEFGEVTRMDLFTMTEAAKRRAVCFLRLDSPDHEQLLMADLGAARFGDDLLVIVDLPS